MTINEDKTLDFIRKKWVNPCPLCGHSKWNIQSKSYELREFHGGNMVVGGSVIPIVPIMCNNCGNTVLVNAFIVGAIEQEKEEKNEG